MFKKKEKNKRVEKKEQKRAAKNRPRATGGAKGKNTDEFSVQEVDEKLTEIIESDSGNAGENPVQETSEVTRFDMSKKKKTFVILMIVIDVLLVGLLVAGIYYKSYKDQQKNEYLQVVDELSVENIVQEASEEMIPSYTFLLYGKHQAAVPTATNGVANFNFDADGVFHGYSAADENDMGVYEVTVRNEEYLLTILCDSGMTSTYIIDFSDSKNIRLTGIDKTKGTFILL